MKVLVVALTATAAAIDAVCYLGLGHVFPPNMTGNTGMRRPRWSRSPHWPWPWRGTSHRHHVVNSGPRRKAMIVLEWAGRVGVAEQT
jgi:Protein of unknown function (DUF1275)